MKIFNIQIQPERAVSFCEKEIESLLKELGLVVEVNSGFDNGRYVNYLFESAALESTWKKLKSLISAHKALQQAAIVSCTGNLGWDDCLLLYHFDKTIRSNQLS